MDYYDYDAWEASRERYHDYQAREESFDNSDLEYECYRDEMRGLYD